MAVSPSVDPARDAFDHAGQKFLLNKLSCGNMVTVIRNDVTAVFLTNTGSASASRSGARSARSAGQKKQRVRTMDVVTKREFRNRGHGRSTVLFIVTVTVVTVNLECDCSLPPCVGFDAIQYALMTLDHVTGPYLLEGSISNMTLPRLLKRVTASLGLHWHCNHPLFTISRVPTPAGMARRGTRDAAQEQAAADAIVAARATQEQAEADATRAAQAEAMRAAARAAEASDIQSIQAVMVELLATVECRENQDQADYFARVSKAAANEAARLQAAKVKVAKEATRRRHVEVASCLMEILDQVVALELLEAANVEAAKQRRHVELCSCMKWLLDQVEAVELNRQRQLADIKREIPRVMMALLDQVVAVELDRQRRLNMESRERVGNMWISIDARTPADSDTGLAAGQGVLLLRNNLAREREELAPCTRHNALADVEEEDACRLDHPSSSPSTPPRTTQPPLSPSSSPTPPHSPLTLSLSAVSTTDDSHGLHSCDGCPNDNAWLEDDDWDECQDGRPSNVGWPLQNEHVLDVHDAVQEAKITRVSLRNTSWNDETIQVEVFLYNATLAGLDILAAVVAKLDPVLESMMQLRPEPDCIAQIQLRYAYKYHTYALSKIEGVSRFKQDKAWAFPPTSIAAWQVWAATATHHSSVHVRLSDITVTVYAERMDSYARDGRTKKYNTHQAALRGARAMRDAQQKVHDDIGPSLLTKTSDAVVNGIRQMSMSLRHDKAQRRSALKGFGGISIAVYKPVRVYYKRRDQHLQTLGFDCNFSLKHISLDTDRLKFTSAVQITAPIGKTVPLHSIGVRFNKSLMFAMLLRLMDAEDLLTIRLKDMQDRQTFDLFSTEWLDGHPIGSYEVGNYVKWFTDPSCSLFRRGKSRPIVVGMWKGKESIGISIMEAIGDDLFSNEYTEVPFPDLGITLRIRCPMSAISADHKFYCRASGCVGGSARSRIHHVQPLAIYFSDDQYAYLQTSIRLRMLWRGRILHEIFKSIMFMLVSDYDKLYTVKELQELLGPETATVSAAAAAEAAKAVAAVAAVAAEAAKAVAAVAAVAAAATAEADKVKKHAVARAAANTNSRGIVPVISAEAKRKQSKEQKKKDREKKIQDREKKKMDKEKKTKEAKIQKAKAKKAAEAAKAAKKNKKPAKKKRPAKKKKGEKTVKERLVHRFSLLRKWRNLAGRYAELCGDLCSMFAAWREVLPAIESGLIKEAMLDKINSFWRLHAGQVAYPALVARNPEAFRLMLVHTARLLRADDAAKVDEESIHYMQDLLLLDSMIALEGDSFIQRSQKTQLDDWFEHVSTEAAAPRVEAAALVEAGDLHTVSWFKAAKAAKAADASRAELASRLASSGKFFGANFEFDNKINIDFIQHMHSIGHDRKVRPPACMFTVTCGM